MREILPYPSTLVGYPPLLLPPILFSLHSSVIMIKTHITSNSVLSPYGGMSNSLVAIPAGWLTAPCCRLTVFFNAAGAFSRRLRRGRAARFFLARLRSIRERWRK